MSIRMTPFKALYGYEALDYADLAFGDSRSPKAKDWIQDSQDILKILKVNLQKQPRINRSCMPPNNGLSGALR